MCTLYEDYRQSADDDTHVGCDSIIPLRIACRLAHINVNKSYETRRKQRVLFCIPCQLCYSQHTLHYMSGAKRNVFLVFLTLNIKIEDCMQKKEFRELRRGVAPQKVLLVYVSFLVLLLRVCSIYIILSLAHSFFCASKFLIENESTVNFSLFYALQLIREMLVLLRKRNVKFIDQIYVLRKEKLYIEAVEWYAECMQLLRC